MPKLLNYPEVGVVEPKIGTSSSSSLMMLFLGSFEKFVITVSSRIIGELAISRRKYTMWFLVIASTVFHSKKLPSHVILDLYLGNCFWDRETCTTFYYGTLTQNFALRSPYFPCEYYEYCSAWWRIRDVSKYRQNGNTFWYICLFFFFRESSQLWLHSLEKC